METFRDLEKRILENNFGNKELTDYLPHLTYCQNENTVCVIKIKMAETPRCIVKALSEKNMGYKEIGRTSKTSRTLWIFKTI